MKKPYDARTLRYCARRLANEAKVAEATGKQLRHTGIDTAAFGGAVITCDSLSREFAKEARAIERKARK